MKENRGSMMSSCGIAWLKLLCVILLLVGTVCISNAQQKVSLNLKHEHNLKSVLQILKKQSVYTFTYSEEDIRGVKVSNINLNDVSFQTALNEILKNTNLESVFDGNVVILRKREVKSVSKQEEIKEEILVRGTVFDKNGVPLPGVSVVIKGTSIGVATDNQGNYTLRIPHDKTEIQYSFIGMITQTIAFEGQTNLNVIMQDDKQVLDEIVVVGYGDIAKTKATGAITKVSIQSLKNTQNVSFADGLVGIVPGLYVEESFTNPDTPPQILLRGVGSINSGTEPLIVVDGVQMPTGFNSTVINSNDIKEMSVLKDASATSIYGSRGSNGVIIIKTKQGSKMDKPHITFNARYGVKRPDTDFKNDLMSGSELLDYENKLGLYPEDNAEAQKLYMERKSLGNNIDWSDLLLENEQSKQYDFSIYGGSDKVNYYTSLGYNKVDNIYGSNYKRYAANVRVTYKLADNLEFALSGNFGNIVNKDRRTIGSPISSSFLLNPWEKIYDEDGKPSRNLAYGSDRSAGVAYNPIFIRENQSAISKRKNISGNATVSYKPKEWLTLKGVLGGVYNHNKYRDYEKIIIKGGKLTLTNSDLASYTGTLMATVNKDFNSHAINSVSGIEFNDRESYSFYGLASNFITDAVQNLNAGKTLDKINESSSSAGSFSYFTRINYSYDNKYNLSASFRRDGSSKFGDANKWANFYAVGASINLHKIIKNKASYITTLKLRGSYGTSGNDFIGDFDALSLYKFTESYVNSDAATLARGDNPNLTWEKNNNINLGLDVGLFNNKLYANIDYYIRDTYDLINNRPIALQSGFKNLISNIGKFRNKGVEISMSSTNFALSNFTWTTNLNLSFNTSKVIDLTVDDDLIQRGYVAYKKGMPIRALYLAQWAGVNPKTGYNQYINPDAKTESERLIDYTTNTQNVNTAEISGLREVMNKTSTPKYFGGLTNTFTYKNFDASFLLSFAGGHYVVNSVNYEIRNDVWLNQHKDVRNAWKQVGDKSNLAIRALSYYRPLVDRVSSDYQASTQFLQDASYLKLKNIIVGYTLKSGLTNRLGADNVRFYVQAQNILTFTNIDYIDPEYATSGAVGLSSTIVRGFSLGLTINF